jgi:hypothetical protein
MAVSYSLMLSNDFLKAFVEDLFEEIFSLDNEAMGYGRTRCHSSCHSALDHYSTQTSPSITIQPKLHHAY